MARQARPHSAASVCSTIGRRRPQPKLSALEPLHLPATSRQRDRADPGPTRSAAGAPSARRPPAACRAAAAPARHRRVTVWLASAHRDPVDRFVGAIEAGQAGKLLRQFARADRGARDAGDRAPRNGRTSGRDRPGSAAARAGRRARSRWRCWGRTAAPPACDPARHDGEQRRRGVGAAARLGLDGGHRAVLGRGDDDLAPRLGLRDLLFQRARLRVRSRRSGVWFLSGNSRSSLSSISRLHVNSDCRLRSSVCTLIDWRSFSSSLPAARSQRTSRLSNSCRCRSTFFIASVSRDRCSSNLLVDQCLLLAHAASRRLRSSICWAKSSAWRSRSASHAVAPAGTAGGRSPGGSRQAPRSAPRSRAPPAGCRRGLPCPPVHAAAHHAGLRREDPDDALFRHQPTVDAALCGYIPRTRTGPAWPPRRQDGEAGEHVVGNRGRQQHGAEPLHLVFRNHLLAEQRLIRVGRRVLIQLRYAVAVPSCA